MPNAKFTGRATSSAKKREPGFARLGATDISRQFRGRTVSAISRAKGDEQKNTGRGENE